MEDKRLDKLFGAKLARHEMSPSAGAWEQVAEKIGREKKPVMIWWRAAASLILLAVATFMIWTNFNQDSASLEIASHEIIAPVNGEMAEIPEINAPVEVAVKEPTRTDERRDAVVRKPVTTNPKVAEGQVVVAPRILEMPRAVASIKPTTLVGDLDYLPGVVLPGNMKDELDPTTEMFASADSEKSKVGKFLSKAKDMTPGDLWASIRESKNELFASNRN